jgi:hypothetical protein
MKTKMDNKTQLPCARTSDWYIPKDIIWHEEHAMKFP